MGALQHLRLRQPPEEERRQGVGVGGGVEVVVDVDHLGEGHGGVADVGWRDPRNRPQGAGNRTDARLREYVRILRRAPRQPHQGRKERGVHRTRKQHRVGLHLGEAVDAARLDARRDRVAHRHIAIEQGVNRHGCGGPDELVIVASGRAEQEAEGGGREELGRPSHGSRSLRRCTPARGQQDAPRTYRARCCRARGSPSRAGRPA